MSETKSENIPLVNYGGKETNQSSGKSDQQQNNGSKPTTTTNKSENTTGNNVTHDNTKGEEKSGLKFLTTLSGRRKYTLLLVTNAVFLSSVAFSLLGPFYLTEALKKGMSIANVGVIYGIYEFVIFLTAPLFGTYLVYLGPKFLVVAGIAVGGSCNILFGTLQFCPDGTPFIVMSILVRSVEAVGFSAFITSSFAIVSSEFKENVGLTFGILETGSGLGFMLGPTIGGGLYMLGGFGIPFYVAGVAVLLNGMALYTLLPPIKEVLGQCKYSMLTLLRSPMVIVALFTLFIGMAGIATFDATYAGKLKRMDFSVGMIGVLFSILAFLYSVTSFIWGYITESRNTQSPLIIIGHLVFGIGFFLMGPSNLFPFLASNLVTVLMGMIFVGASIGCHLVPTMKCMVVGAIELGFENNIETYGLVSGLFTSIQTLGTFVGPVVIGYLIQEFDFPLAYTVVGICSVFMVVVTLIFFTIRNLRRKEYGKHDNVQP